MDKRVLMVATVPSMIGQFNMNNITLLLDLGYQVDVAADFTDTSIWTTDRVQAFKDQLTAMGVQVIQLGFSRHPLKINKHFKSYKDTLLLLKNKQYSFIHTHTPIASAIVRFAAHKANTKVIYTAHGFHFYNGAPLKNWIVFYPVEKWLSKYTDTLITITKEDYKRALKRFKAKEVAYIPGVGVDTKKFNSNQLNRNRIRSELGLSKTDWMLLSVGELNSNKNHSSVIKAITGIKDIVYVIVGKGEKQNELEALAKDCSVDLRLAGFRMDVVDFYGAADVYILPSIREGLNVSLMEAMSSGLPCLCGNIRGNVDLIDENGGLLFNPASVNDIKRAIKTMLNMPNRRSLELYNSKKIQEFDARVVNESMRKIYEAFDKEAEIKK